MWLVSKLGLDTNTGHASTYPINLAADAKLTINAAVNAAVSGDTIIIWPGTYDENIIVTAKTLNLVGINKNSSIIAPAAGTPLTLGAGTSGSLVKNLRLDSVDMTSAGKGFVCQYSEFTIEDCIINGPFDAIFVPQATNFRIYRTTFNGKYDGGNFSNSTDFFVRDCIFTSDGTYGTGNPVRGLYVDNAKGIFECCNFTAIRNDNSAETCAGITTISGTNSYLQFNKCKFYAYNGLNNMGICAAVEIAGSGAYVIIKNCLLIAPGQKGSIYGLLITTGNRVIINDSILYATGTTPTERFYIKNSGTVIVNGCYYSISPTIGISGVITNDDSRAIPWLQQNVPVGASL